MPWCPAIYTTHSVRFSRLFISFARFLHPLQLCKIERYPSAKLCFLLFNSIESSILLFIFPLALERASREMKQQPRQTLFRLAQPSLRHRIEKHDDDDRTNLTFPTTPNLCDAIVSPDAADEGETTGTTDTK